MNNEQQVQQAISGFCAKVINYMHGIALVMDAEWEADRAEQARVASVVVSDVVDADYPSDLDIAQLVADIFDMELEEAIHRLAVFDATDAREEMAVGHE